MAKKPQSKRPVATFQGYIPVYTTEIMRKAIKGNPGTAEARCDRFKKYVEDGYRLTITWDEYNECFSVSLYDTDVRRPSAGYVLAAKHVELDIAMDTLVHLHEKVYADGWDIEHVGNRGDVSW